MLRTRFAFAIAFAATSLLAASGQPFHRTFHVSPGGTLTVDADVGDIRVSSGSGDTVTIDVTQTSRSDRFMEITADQEGSNVTVRGKFDKTSRWLLWNFNGDARWVITVPSSYNVDLATSGGDIKVSDVGGQAHVKTSGGGISLGHIEGPVVAHTSGGDISVDGVRGNADIHTSGGGIRIGDVTGNIEAKTSGGSIEVQHAGGDLL
ncbi:MAG TPA: DUF4097 family beta strand repeat-containing protein, partial [Thermoanaerobaculia bacterium]|nr:DUF4097 family beta strand repeat-containing protein [Thermoanaerobaculia bacterium]